MKPAVKLVRTNGANILAARRREIGWIHAAKTALNICDADYRAILQRITGKNSSAECTAAERAAILREFHRLGWEKPQKKRFDQHEKIRWLWGKLAEAGVLRSTSEQALLALVARTTGMSVSSLRFLPPFESSKTIECLKAMLARASARPATPAAAATAAA